MHGAYLRVNPPKLDFATKYSHKERQAQQIAYRSKRWVSPTHEADRTRRSVLLPKLCGKVELWDVPIVRTHRAVRVGKAFGLHVVISRCEGELKLTPSLS